MASTARTALTAVASLAALASVAACGGADGTTTTPEATSATEASTDSGAETTTATDGATSPYLDGTYSATGSYVSPGGRQSIDITLTLLDGVVTEVEATPAASDPNSELYQEKFVSGLDDVVVGVALDELAVDKVAGSSLTSGGFADAVEQIKQQAGV